MLPLRPLDGNDTNPAESAPPAGRILGPAPGQKSSMADSSQTPPSLKHELRTPLNHIIGFCEMLIEEANDTVGTTADHASLVPDLHRIHGAGRRLLGVINDLFDSSIPESERLDEARIHHEVRTPLNQIIGYSELLQEEAAGVERDAFVDDLAKIHSAARRLLALVLANFGAARFPVADFEGLDPECPVATLHRTAPDGDTEGVTRAPKGKILLADDDAANREMLARRLERLGHSVATAANGREVVDRVRTEPYDLLLLDIVMPEMNGYEVLEHLHDNPPPLALPVIVLSASDDVGKVARCIELGAEDYLPKPFDPSLLQARIGSCLEKKRLRDREALYLRTIQKEKERSDDLLHVILPASIAAELKATGEVRPRRVEKVAVLFADVVNFTKYCENRAPETIHRDLQSLVRELEILASEHGMEKIKTIGDAFLAAAGLLNRSASPALDAVRGGLAMLRRAESLPAAWQLRIGIHVGPIVAGIVGRQKFQYDLWGDTVNIASRMQAEARPGTLCVNADTWQVLEAHCLGTSLGHREVKGKGRHEIYEVTGLRGSWPI